jgi:RNase H-like domain found in reverse transcriptase
MGFTNFYRRFILRFSKVIRPITDILIDMIKGKKTGKFHWSKKANNAFGMLKNLFTTIFILRMFNPSLRIRMKTDASGFALNAVISQLFSDLASMRNE